MLLNDPDFVIDRIHIKTRSALVDAWPLYVMSAVFFALGWFGSFIFYS